MEAHRIHRLLKQITLLQTGRRCTTADLLGTLGIARRTLFRDLGVLRLAGVPVRFDAAKRGHFIDRQFFLPPINFNLPEVLGLMLLVHEYASPEAVPNFDAVLTAMLKIESTLPPGLRAQCGSALDRIEARPGPMTDA